MFVYVFSCVNAEIQVVNVQKIIVSKVLSHKWDFLKWRK